MNEHIPDTETYIKRLNWYLQEHYPANKKITAEEWNALFLALINQGNAQEDTLAKICNEYLPLQIEKINTLVDTTNEHEASIAQLRTDTNKALKDSNYAVITADTALNQVVEKMGTVAYINNVLAPSLHYTRDPQAQLNDTAQGIINLQSQIDLMEQNTNVADVVGTFVDLVNYDKSKITANDIVEVLQDETRANADTYYRLVENAWVYIGKLGSYYTRGESDALLAEKVNYADYKDTLSFAENERQKSKNLFNINNCLYHKSSNLGETGTNITTFDSNIRITLSPNNLIKVNPNTQYTLSTNNSNFKYAIGQLTSNKTTLGDNGWHTNSSFTITTSSTTEYLGINFGKTDDSEISKTDYNNFLSSNIQLEEGSVATDYQPYNGQITHNGDAPVVFAENERQKSKNLFDLNYNGTFNSTTETSVSKYIALKSVYGEKFTINTNLPQYSFSRSSVGDIYTNIIFKNLKPNTSYTISFTPISVDNGVVHFLGVYNVQDKLNTKVTKTITTDENGRFDTGYGIWISAQNTTFVVKDIQAEEGSTATDYQPYYGQITHNGDPAVEFAESERQKSKNLFNINKLSFGYTPESWSINYNTGTITFVNSGPNSTGALCLKDFTDLKAGKTYKLSYAYTGTPSNLFIYLNGSDSTWSNGDTHTITQAELDSGIHMYGNSTGTVTLSDIIMVEDGVDIDYQPYNGAIVHEKQIADVEHIKVVYDKSSSNSAINWGYNNGLKAEAQLDGVLEITPPVSLKTTSKYRVYVNWGGDINIFTASVNQYGDRISGCSAVWAYNLNAGELQMCEFYYLLGTNQIQLRFRKLLPSVASIEIQTSQYVSITKIEEIY